MKNHIDHYLIWRVLENEAERDRRLAQVRPRLSSSEVHSNWLKKQYKNWPAEKKAVRKEQIAKRKKLA